MNLKKIQLVPLAVGAFAIALVYAWPHLAQEPQAQLATKVSPPASPAKSHLSTSEMVTMTKKLAAWNREAKAFVERVSLTGDPMTPEDERRWQELRVALDVALTNPGH